ncbi:MAG: hypothetical protein K0R28_2928, partial [Paenibacillus sp.]|nr:hypothetical protein [Paenibacillus sp.]
MDRIASVEQFKEITNRDSFSVVKYYTTWCPDC